MTLKQLFEALKTITGFSNKIAYRSIKDGTALPYAVYYEDTSNNFVADNSVYVKGSNITLELYTTNKDVATEEKFESLFNSNELVWNKSELYLDDEKCFETIYSFTI